MMYLRGSDYGRCNARRLEYPGTGNLGRGDTPLFGDLFYCRGNNEIVLTKIIVMRKRIGFGALGQDRAPLGLTVTGKETARQRAPRNERHALVDAQRIHLPFFLTIDQVVMVLHGHEAMPPFFLGQRERLGKLPGRHAARAYIAHLAAAHEGIKGFQGFFNRSGEIPAVDLIQVDVIHFESTQRIFTRLNNVLAAQPTTVWPGGHLAPYFGGNDDVIAYGQLPQPVSGDLLTQTDRVDVGGIEKVYAGFEGQDEMRARFGLIQRPVAWQGPFGLRTAAIAHTAETEP